VYSSLLNKIEILDNAGLYKEADAALRKIISQEFAHNKYKNIKTADVNHWTKFTNFDEVLKKLFHWRKKANYDELEKNREYPCGELETIVNGEKIKISVWFNLSEDGAFFSINEGKIVIGNVWNLGRYLAHEVNHAYEDILEVKKVGEITRPFKNFDELSQNTWSKETIGLARKHLFPGKKNKIIQMLDDSFRETKYKIKQKMFKNEKDTENPKYWEKIIDKKLPQDLRQSIINDLKKMTLGFREYYRLPNEVRSRLSEILYSLSTDHAQRDRLLQAEPKKFVEYFKSLLGENYLLLTPEQKEYILNNVYQSLRGGRQQTITNNIINSIQDGIKRGLLPKNIGQMYPVQIKQLINKNPEIKQFISVMRANTGISDDELIETIQKAANNQIQTQTTTNSGEHSYNDILRQRQDNPDLEEERAMVEQSDSQSRLSPEMVEKTQTGKN